MKSSLVIPCFNSYGTIHLCLDSVKQQSVPFVEVIIVCNLDHEISFLEAKYPEFRFVVNQRLGASSSRNKGVRSLEKNCDFIAFVDADVIIEENWNEKMLLFVEHNSFVAAQSCVRPVPFKDQKRNLDAYRLSKKCFYSNNTYNDYFNSYDNNFLNTAAIMISFEAFNLVKGFDESLLRFEDLDISKKLKCVGEISGNLVCFADVIFDRGLFSYLLRSYYNGIYSIAYDKLWDYKFRIHYYRFFDKRFFHYTLLENIFFTFGRLKSLKSHEHISSRSLKISKFLLSTRVDKFKE